MIESTDIENYIPSPIDWVREQVEAYESSGGTEGTTLLDTGLPCILITHVGNKTRAVRKTPLMRVKKNNSYVLVGSNGGDKNDPVWVHNLRKNNTIKLRDREDVFSMEVREVIEQKEIDALWGVCTEAFPPYEDYKKKTSRQIPIFLAEPLDQ